MTIDLDSTICPTYGLAKQGMGFGYTKVRGYHPLLATRAGSGEMLHQRLRGGSAHTARGAVWALRETFARVRAAGGAPCGSTPAGPGRESWRRRSPACGLYR